MRDYQTIKVAIQSAVATITLARPARLNAMSPEMAEELNAALDALPATPARALIITGEGRAFCSGADLAGEDGEVVIPEDTGEVLERLINPLIERLARLSIPVIAAVNGPAAGVGCSLALAADLVIAARSAYFLLAFVNIGLVPDGGATWRLPRLVGQARAMEMLMLGERIGAEQAADWGMIYRAVEDTMLAGSAADLAARLAAGPTQAYGLLRTGMRAALASTLTDSLTLERENQKRAGHTADFREGITAFLEKRKAVFSGA